MELPAICSRCGCTQDNNLYCLRCEQNDAYNASLAADQENVNEPYKADSNNGSQLSNSSYNDDDNGISCSHCGCTQDNNQDLLNQIILYIFAFPTLPVAEKNPFKILRHSWGKQIFRLSNGNEHFY